jgi:hypothetical protein
MLTWLGELDSLRRTGPRCRVAGDRPCARELLAAPAMLCSDTVFDSLLVIAAATAGELRADATRAGPQFNCCRTRIDRSQCHDGEDDPRRQYASTHGGKKYLWFKVQTNARHDATLFERVAQLASHTFFF